MKALQLRVRRRTAAIHHLWGSASKWHCPKSGAQSAKQLLPTARQSAREEPTPDPECRFGARGHAEDRAAAKRRELASNAPRAAKVARSPRRNIVRRVRLPPSFSGAPS